MPEHPDSATSEAAAPTDLVPGRAAIAPEDAGPDAPVTLDDFQDVDGGHDLGGEA